VILLNFRLAFGSILLKSKTGETDFKNPILISLVYLAFAVGVEIPVSLAICLNDLRPSFTKTLIIAWSVSSSCTGMSRYRTAYIYEFYICQVLCSIGFLFLNDFNIVLRFKMNIRILMAILGLSLVMNVLVFAINNTQGTNSTQFTIAAVGDWACNNNTQNTVKNIVENKPELVLALGDLSYQRDADCWFDIIAPIDNITTVVRGDHDNDRRMDSYKQHFNMTSDFYSFDRGGVHLLVMSTETPYEMNSDQYVFVKQDLEDVSTNSDIHSIIVAYHQPAYTSPTSCEDAVQG
jgi:predicted phosphodiesterase